MQYVVLIAGGFAALVHVGFFVLESLLFMRPGVWSQFAASEADAAVLRPVFWNQGFYNLFLAIGLGTGVVMLATEGFDMGAGIALVAFTCATMVGAAMVLVSTGRSYAPGALLQGLAPLVALLALLAHART